MKAREIGNLLKDRLRQLESGKCKILSKGSDCGCNLCLVDNLLFYISVLKEEGEDKNKGVRLDHLTARQGYDGV